MSEAVEVAKIIRKELKKHGIEATVRKSSYRCVNIKVRNQLPATIEAINSFCSQFKLGHFDGMTDCYEYSNSNSDLPQVEYIFVDNNFSREMVDAAEQYIADNYDTSTWGTFEKDTMPRQILTGCKDSNFWYEHKQRVAA